MTSSGLALWPSQSQVQCVVQRYWLHANCAPHPVHKSTCVRGFTAVLPTCLLLRQDGNFLWDLSDICGLCDGYIANCLHVPALYISGGRVHWAQMRRLPHVTRITGNNVLIPQAEVISVSSFCTYFHMVIPKIRFCGYHSHFLYSTPGFPWSRNSSVGIATGSGIDGRGSIPGKGKMFFFTPHRPDWL
jgi:hypothetical protein